MSKIIFEVDIKQDEAIRQLIDVKKKIDDETKALKELKSFNMEGSQEYKNLTKSIYENKQRLSELTSAVKQSIKEDKSKEGSMKQLGAELAINKERYRTLSEAERNNAAVGGQLLNTIQQQDAKIKQLDATLGNHQRNVGNYKIALDGLKSQFLTIFSAAGLANLATGALTSALNGIKQFISGATDKFIEQDKAVTKLKFAIDGNIQQLEQYKARAAEIQNQTVFGDESIIAVQAYGAALGLTQEQINKLVDASVQLSTVTGQDLKTSSEMLAKTYTGDVVRSLKVYIRDTGDLTKEQIKNGAVVDMIAEKYKGFAEAQALTSVGALQQLKNELGDTQERIGQHTIQFQIYWEQLKGTLAEESVEMVKKFELVQGLFTGFNNEIEQATAIFNQQKKEITNVIEAYAGLTDQTKEQVALNLQNIKSTSELLKVYGNMVYIVGKMNEEAAKGNELSEEEIKLQEERKKAAEEAAKARAAALSELEKLRIEAMENGIEKEKAAEMMRYENFIKGLDKKHMTQVQYDEALELAKQVHEQKINDIEAAYRKVREDERKKETDAIVHELEKQLAEIEKQNIARDEKERKMREATMAAFEKDLKDKTELSKQFADQLSGIVSASIDEQGLNIKKFGQGLSIFLLDILEKQVQASVVSATAQSFTTPDSVLTAGASGALRAGILAGLIKAAFNAVKGIIMADAKGFQVGGYTGRGASDEPAGTVHKNEIIWSERDIAMSGGVQAVEAMRPTSNINTPTASSYISGIVEAIKKMKIFVSVEEINAVNRKYTNRIKVSQL